MKNLIYTLALLFVCQLGLANNTPTTENPQPEKKTITIKRGTPITLQLIDNVSSADMETNNTIEMMVLIGVEGNGHPLIETGTYAEGRIVKARRAGIFGRGAYLQLEGTGIRTVDNQVIPISSVKTTKIGQERKVLAVGASVALPAIGITMGTPVLLPFAAVGLLIRGKEVEIHKGTLLRAKLKYDITVKVP